jgi:hypothetical protein
MGMRGMVSRLGWTTGLLLASLAVGCTTSPTTTTTTTTPASPPDAAAEVAVREQFAQLQSAIKNRDADKIWTLLDSQNHADAEREAKAIQAAHAKYGPKDKAKIEAMVGLSGTDVAGLTGVGYVKTKLFLQGEHHDELPGSKIDKVTVEGDKARVDYVEADGDKDKVIFVRQDGQWKARLVLMKFHYTPE